jgi:hypothetical protein
MVRQYKDTELLARVKELDSFDEIPSGRWILGVRSNEDNPNSFDDKFYLFDGETFVDVLKGTTNPGTPTLKQFEKVNKDGAFILKADQWYYNVWKFGRHHGKVDALLQLGSKVIGFRDIDKDDKSEQIGKMQIGYFGINFHPNTYNASGKGSDSIGWWSAGCQVVNDSKYNATIKWFKENQHTVTYCLIQEF